MLSEIHDMDIDGHSLHFFGTCTDKEACKRRQESDNKIAGIKES
jgi:Fur family ferric uptake transcriptional regulator